MKTRIVVSLISSICVFNTFSDELVQLGRPIIPGKGIPGIVELGMTQTEATDSIKDMIETVEYRSDHISGERTITRVIAYPDFGIIADFKEADTVRLISVTTENFPVQDNSQLQASYLGSLLYGNTNIILKGCTKEMIVNVFGEVEEFDHFQHEGNRDHSVKFSENYEVIWYQSKGVQFHFVDDLLAEIKVFIPKKEKQEIINISNQGIDLTRDVAD